MTTPTAPLPSAAVEAIHRLEARLAGLMDGESVVINGATCTRISPQVADTLTRHAAASRTCRQLSASSGWMAAGEFDRLADVQDELAMYHSQIEQADHLARLTAKRETADRIVALVGDWDGGESSRLMVSVTDPETNTRLATTFVTYAVEPAVPPLHLVREAS